MIRTKLLPLIILVFAITACNNNESVSSEYSTRVKDMVQADVFDVLPTSTDEILVYNSPEEIEGEYLELASVELSEVNQLKEDKKEMMSRLLDEARGLGSNGVLLVSNTTTEANGSIKKEIKAVAIYALDRAPVLGPIAKL